MICSGAATPTLTTKAREYSIEAKVRIDQFQTPLFKASRESNQVRIALQQGSSGGGANLNQIARLNQQLRLFHGVQR